MCSAVVLFFLNKTAAEHKQSLNFSDFFQTNYPNTSRTELHEIYRIGRTSAVDERSEVIFVELLRDVDICVNAIVGLKENVW